jgi:hypothetical protein
VRQLTRLSDIVRHLAFAGIACIWVLRYGDRWGPVLTIELTVAAFFLVCALGTDLLEAGLRVVVSARGGTLSLDDEGSGRGWRHWVKGSPERVLLFLKLGLVVMAYLWLLAHIYGVIVEMQLT